MLNGFSNINLYIWIIIVIIRSRRKNFRHAAALKLGWESFAALVVLPGSNPDLVGAPVVLDTGWFNPKKKKRRKNFRAYHESFMLESRFLSFCVFVWKKKKRKKKEKKEEDG